MPGPLSTPNGDTGLARGHVNERFACVKHAEKELDECYLRASLDESSCVVVPLRTYLASRNRLRTGKTK